MMAEAIAPIDAEALAVSYLSAKFTERSMSTLVATKVPVDRPDRMVIVSLPDTQQTTLVHHAHRLIFQCYAESELAAGELGRKAYGIMRAIEGDDSADVWVSEVVTVGGPVNFPDPDIGDRYQFTLDIQTRGEVI